MIFFLEINSQSFAKFLCKSGISPRRHPVPRVLYLYFFRYLFLPLLISYEHEVANPVIIISARAMLSCLENHPLFGGLCVYRFDAV